MTDALPAATEVTAPPAAAAVPPPPAPLLGLEFTGRAGEYFRIWIVNLFFTVATLGIYSAWAKVRRRRYFYGHTWVAGSNFEYHGDPRVILRGRLLALLLFLAYTLIGNFSPRAAAAAALAALPLAPWLLLRSFRFNAVNTSFRHVRFGFEGRYGAFLAALSPLVIFPLVTVLFGRYDPNGARQPTTAELVALLAPSLVFLLAYPWMSGRLHLMRVNGSRFGSAPFLCRASVPQFYAIYIIAVLLGVALGAAFFTPIVLLTTMTRAFSAALILIPFAYLALFTLVFAYTQSRVANTVYNDTVLQPGVRLRSTLKARRLATVYATNLLAIAATLGFAIPWAAIRVARVRAQALALDAPAGIDHFLAGVDSEVGATGEEVGELFAFDVAL